LGRVASFSERARAEEGGTVEERMMEASGARTVKVQATGSDQHRYFF
jgi:hypothetical protein